MPLVGKGIPTNGSKISVLGVDNTPNSRIIKTIERSIYVASGNLERQIRLQGAGSTGG